MDCEHNDNTHGDVVSGQQLVICDDCGKLFNMTRPNMGWHVPDDYDK